jgi:CHAT domain-containing protein
VDKLYSLNLEVDLVTLSACETGLSKIANGDDLVGLTRGFLYAGSSSIVASLWKVDDRATAELMTRFYKELLKNDKVEALREAQLETKKKYPHPYYWASFQLTGNAK